MSTSFCETCAERGRSNEPVYKLGMCEFCFKGLRHLKATSEQLTKERGRERPAADTLPVGELGVRDAILSDRVNYSNLTS